MPQPLRPELYGRLKRQFIHVEIANPGQEMVANYQKVGDHFSLNITRWGETYRVNCPHCPGGDNRKRLYINHCWGLFDEKTNSRNLGLIICFNEDCFKFDRSRSQWLYNDLFSSFDSYKEEDVVYSGIPAIERPFHLPGKLMQLEQLESISPDHAALSYLRKRNFEPLQLAKDYKLSFCMEADQEYGQAVNRLIIPVYYEAKAVGWQGRYIGEPPSKQIAKYYNMHGFKKSQYIYNYDEAKKSLFVVVVEGPTDVWRFGPEAVALFGKKASERQVKLLGEWSKLVILLDGDCKEEGDIKSLERVLERNHGAMQKRLIVSLPKNMDPGDMEREYLRSLVLNNINQAGWLSTNF
jgi:hypothetical protein